MHHSALEQLHSRREHEFFGKYRGRVVNNNDPLHKGRVKVTVAQVLDEVEVWALPCVPYAGRSRGFFAMPEVGTSVWVEFEAGDPSHPIWTGCFWNDNEIAEADASPAIKFFRTGKFTLRINDDDGEVLIDNGSGSSIKLTASEIVIKSATVRQEGSGGRKTVLSATAFRVNDGGLEVT